jgi:tol-pal system protein YbgF
MQTPRLMLRSPGRALLALALCAATLPTRAALFEDEDARRAILDLRQRLEAVNQTLKVHDEDNARLRGALLDLQSQIDALKADLSRARGQNEQLVRDLTEVQQRQKDVQVGVDERLRRFEPIKVSVDGREFMAEPQEKRDYDQAMDTFRKGDFNASVTQLSGFVLKYAQSGFLPSALFWLGNAEYATRDYKESMAHFRQMLTLAPSHPRSPEAMLAISNVQIELKDLKGARKTLEDLMKAYPSSDAASTAKDRLARLR